MAITAHRALVLLLVSLVYAHVEEDFAFDSEAEPAPSTDSLGKRTVQRNWGVPDTTAFVGHLFRYRVPIEAFSGDVGSFEARSKHGQPLPAWLLFNRASGTMEGVPTHKDMKEYYVLIRAFSPDKRNSAEDIFSINVVSSDGDIDGTPVEAMVNPHVVHYANRRCSIDQGRTIVTILMDVRFDRIKPKQRIITIENLSGFLSLPHDIFKLEPDSTHEDLTGESVITAGEGNIKNKKWKQSSVIHWQVGCDGKIWPEQSKIVDHLKQQGLDGTLAEVLRWPVIGWYVKTEQSSYLMRDQAMAGSGWPDTEREDIDSDVNELNNQVIPSLVSRTTPELSSSFVSSSVHVDDPHHTTVHHVRHHHDDNLDASGTVLESSFPPYLTASFSMHQSQLVMTSTPTLDPIRPTLLGNARDYTVTVEPTPSLPPGYESSSMFVPSPSPESETWDTDDFDLEGVSQPPPESSPTNIEFDATNGTTDKTDSMSSSTPIPSSTSRDFSGRGSIQPKNVPPYKQHQLRKLHVTAGKILRERIPDDTFIDTEDGDTTKLKLELKSIEGHELNRTYWIQLIQLEGKPREIIALPLEDHVSKWQFFLTAADISGATANDTLEVSVQHHKGRRTVNHEFVLVGEPDANMRDQKVVPWEIELVEGLAKFFGDKDSSQITVLHVDLSQLSSHGPITFAWKNDSLPRDSCPEKEVQRMVKAMTKDGDKPSDGLVRSLGMLADHLTITKISYKGLMNCETSTKPPSTPPGDINNPPVLRNHVDHIPATIGQLLTFIVPEDTFYDQEDDNTRNMKLSLLTMDHSPIPANSWLQFDEKNQEFFGVPMPLDEGTQQYQLVCMDKGGKTVQDGLVVVVHRRPPNVERYGVEFSMNLDTSSSPLVLNAALKRKFISKIAEVVDDKNTSSIIIANISESLSSTLIRWFNSSLPTDKCPNAEIRHLRQLFLEDDGSLLPRVAAIMSPEFTPNSVELQPTAICQGELTPVHVTDLPPPPVDEPTPLGVGDEYLITFVVPAVIICVMLLLASVVACMLYRRRRNGKMTIGDEDERQSYRNKGIPVIFQDELEERPEPANKSPVIMKDEKPPLPPPEYRRDNPSPPPTAALLSDTEDAGPYQPPPPFTTSRDTGRQTRQKHTPTYRKPPAYVPP